MAKYRARFNDKARAGAVAKRNAFKKKAQKQFNVDVDEEKLEAQVRMHEMARPESDARKRVRMALQFPERANAAKKKRLDKYIEKQVRKEEKDILLQRLAKQHAKVDHSQMHSMGSIGSGTKSFANLGSDEDSQSDSEEESQNGNLNSTDVLQDEESHLDEESQSEDQKSDSDEKSQDEDSQSEDEQTNMDESQSDRSPGSPVHEKQELNFIKPIANVPLSFGFGNLPVKKKQKAKTSWRERLGIPAAQELLEKTTGSGSDEDDSEEDDSESSEDSKEEDGEEEDGEEEDSEEEDSEEEDSEGGEEQGDSEDNDKTIGKSFAEWARSLETENTFIPTPKPENYTHQPRATLGEENAHNLDKESQRPGYVARLPLTPIVVNRSDEIKASRSELPACQNEQQVMEAIHHFDVVVITGATGSGKTTQIPQFLFESGYANKGTIGVTQPRRVAAVSMSKRIGYELGMPQKVGYQIRFDSKVNDDTKIKLMTDGVLLKEMSTDLLLTKYSSIVVDEAHERSVNTDILIGLLSRVVKHRREINNPLKLIIMSATLRVSDFVENRGLFEVEPPVVNIEARQFTVTNHFSRRTSVEYVDEAVKKTKKIHERLPKGGILVFLTGKDEIQRAVAELDPFSTKPQNVVNNLGSMVAEEENVEFGDVDELHDNDKDDDNNDNDRDMDGKDDYDEMENDEESDFEIDDEDKDEDHDQKKLYVLPLYSLLSTEDQMKVFDKVPKGHRLCVVATNVAETSLTIPGIRYVVDCGRSKQRLYDVRTGIQKYKVKWVSKASADQRAGRAGRTGPGHCYRLFSSAVYEADFPQFGDPEVLRMPIEGLVLQMKAMGLDKIINFPFPTPIPEHSLRSGVDCLRSLGALDVKEKITKLGEQMSLFPLHPRHAKMLLIGNQNDCLAHIIALVATLSVSNIFLDKNNVPMLDAQADVLQQLSAFAAFSYDPSKELCENIGLRIKPMLEAKSLRGQLATLVAKFHRPDAVQSVTQQLLSPVKVPTPLQISTLRQIVAAGFIDLVAIRQQLVSPNEESAKIGVKQVSRVPYVTASVGPVAYIAANTIMRFAPDLVVYQTLTSSESERVRLVPLTAITMNQLAALAANTKLITYSKPLGGAYAPKQTAAGRQVWLVPHFSNGGQGWDLPPQKVIQKRVQNKWVNI